MKRLVIVYQKIYIKYQFFNSQNEEISVYPIRLLRKRK